MNILYKDIIYKIFYYTDDIIKIGKMAILSKRLNYLIKNYEPITKYYKFSEYIIKKYGKFIINRIDILNYDDIDIYLLYAYSVNIFMNFDYFIQYNSINIFKYHNGRFNRSNDYILEKCIIYDSYLIFDYMIIYINNIQLEELYQKILEYNSSKCLEIFMKNINNNIINYRKRYIKHICEYISLNFMLKGFEIFNISYKDYINDIIRLSDKDIIYFINEKCDNDLLLSILDIYFKKNYPISPDITNIIVNRLSIELIKEKLLLTCSPRFLKNLYILKIFTNIEVFSYIDIYLNDVKKYKNIRTLFNIIECIDKININKNYNDKFFDIIKFVDSRIFTDIYMDKNYNDFLIDHPYYDNYKLLKYFINNRDISICTVILSNKFIEKHGNINIL